MTVVSQSLRMRGKAETNSIAISGWVWRWGDNRLEYARTAIGPGLGMGIFPGVLKYKSRCCVAAMPTIGSARQTLRVNLVKQHRGFLGHVSVGGFPFSVSNIKPFLCTFVFIVAKTSRTPKFHWGHMRWPAMCVICICA